MRWPPKGHQNGPVKTWTVSSASPNMAGRLAGRPPARLSLPGRGGVDELTISVTAGSAYTLVTLTGECDLHTGRQLRDVLTSEVSRGARRMILEYCKYLAILARESLLSLGPKDRQADASVHGAPQPGATS